ncbi:hypothetical protein [Streptomyces sp. KL116D]|uniref:hypothetical protein n=1 Tax=Streptomyces sp. KL116D TaxID=3045152 RepID=UPI003557F2BF
MVSLEALFAPDVVSLSPTATRMRGCARVPVLGRARVARLSAYRQLWRDAVPELVDANGTTGVLIHRDGRPSLS